MHIPYTNKSLLLVVFFVVVVVVGGVAVVHIKYYVYLLDFS